MPVPIHQPPDAALHGNGLSCRIVWSADFSKSRTDSFQQAQRFIDSKCIGLMDKFTPARNLLLAKSVIQGTVIGSGHLIYESPYGKYQYYGVVWGPNIPITENGVLVGFWSPKHKRPTDRKLNYSKARHPLAQRMWFEPMKKQHAPQILRGAAAIAGGVAK